MSKKFNIHEWQANQAKQRLVENDEYQKRQDDMTPGKNPDFFYDDNSIFGKLKKDPDYIKKLNTKNAKKDVSESLNPEVSRSVDRFITAMASRYGYNEQDAVFAIMAALRQRNFDGVNEAEGVKHYTKDGKEWTGPTHKMPNGKLMTQSPHNEDSEELFHKEDLDEMNTTGGGASFNAGSGEGYMTPNAFKKKKKK